ncbi:TRAP transporter fused permease subunit [Fusibacter paucivorans]|uniref:TRAP transporter fused permease subunit n=1 Tax=Fusibacter paucivorans TaxID=76009 RepID=A0ABS5PQ80_9FIRM|nr:TRAP transporter fused permease subunit [Fusibacter paucivorans]MBS7526187.1 TRAP transporter fused permease subunit [Fusibacter paucivorans]
MAYLKENWRKIAPGLITITLVVFQLLAMTLAIIPVMAHRMIFLALVLLVLFIRVPKNAYEKITNYISIPLLIALIVYATVNSDRISTRIVFVEKLLTIDKVFGMILIVLVLEATRRLAGNVLLGLVAFFMAFGFLGPHIPGVLRHSGFSIRTFVETNFMSSGGIFGAPISAVISYVFYFLLFTSFLEYSGGGKLFIDVAMKVAGRSRGGTAKASVIASGAMGMISGSAVANVVAVGSLTIPLMKNNGFDGESSAGIVAAASTGGQLMPPIMGAAAFIMAETTGISYGKIALAAALPAFFYYYGIFAQVDFYARRHKLDGLKKDQLPILKESIKKYGHLMIPLFLLIYYIGAGTSVMSAGLKSTALLIVLSFLSRETRMLPKKIMQALTATVAGLPAIAIPCAAAGIIISTVISSNLATKFSGLFVALAGGNIFISLLAVMFVCIILGMGMPTISAYIIVSMLLVPTLIELGIPVLAANLFAFYFALLSFVTPPVALSAYTAAGIANSDPSKTGWKAFKFTFAGFIIPFVFAFDPALLMEGNALWIAWSFLTTGVGVWILAGAISGWYLTKASRFEMILGAAAAIVLIIPTPVTDIIGAVCAIVVIASSLRKSKKLVLNKEF